MAKNLRTGLASLLALLTGAGACRTGGVAADQPLEPQDRQAAVEQKRMEPKVVKSDDEWRRVLTPEQCHVLREKGTERAFTGKYWNNHAEGVYVCAACGTPLFSSDTKYDSGTGWPSFWKPMDSDNVVTEEDSTLFMRRTEVLCAVCGGHLGHVFPDGPAPSGQRFCMNSVSLSFVPEDENKTAAENKKTGE